MKNNNANCNAPIEIGEKIKTKLREYTGKKSFCSISGGSSVELCGCCGLITYRDCLMEIALCDSFVQIDGSCLTLRHYYGGRMIICGRISSIKYHSLEDLPL